MIILKIPLILLLLDLLLRVIDLNNIMHVKNDRQRNNDCGWYPRSVWVWCIKSCGVIRMMLQRLVALIHFSSFL